MQRSVGGFHCTHEISNNAYLHSPFRRSLAVFARSRSIGLPTAYKHTYLGRRIRIQGAARPGAGAQGSSEPVQCTWPPTVKFVQTLELAASRSPVWAEEARTSATNTQPTAGHSTGMCVLNSRGMARPVSCPVLPVFPGFSRFFPVFPGFPVSRFFELRPVLPVFPGFSRLFPVLVPVLGPVFFFFDSR